MDGALKFLADNKAWWITPIVLVLALVAVLAIFGGDPDPADPDGATPFTYDVH